MQAGRAGWMRGEGKKERWARRNTKLCAEQLHLECQQIRLHSLLGYSSATIYSMPLPPQADRRRGGGRRELDRRVAFMWSIEERRRGCPHLIVRRQMEAEVCFCENREASLLRKSLCRPRPCTRRLWHVKLATPRAPPLDGPTSALSFYFQPHHYAGSGVADPSADVSGSWFSNVGSPTHKS